ncbi:MAG: AraC family transcriptional regulator [Clostridiaceae bacterium]|nr:AraC family transcriptional regulator [Clostridiaceae bacterium]
MNNYLFPVITYENTLPFYVKGVGGLENQEHIIRPNGYHDFQWLHCVKGKGKLIINNKEFFIPRNSGFFMYPGVPHQYFAVEEPWETHWVVFGGYGVVPLLNALGFSQYNVFRLNDIRPLDNLINDIYILSQSKNLLSGYRCSAKLYNLLIELKVQTQESLDTANVSRYNKLRPVLDYIDNNYMNNPTMDELASLINVSPQYFCRIFNNVLGIRPFTYLNLIKLRNAKELLIKHPEMQIKEVASKVGYNDVSYFCAVFKKHEGVTPMEFKINSAFHIT